MLYAGLIIYYRVGWKSLKAFPAEPDGSTKVFISVIIPARNEEANLPALLESLGKQSYPKNNFEVIIVDDHSSDSTGSIVSGFPLPNLKLIKLEDHVQDSINSYKKKAIEIAINQSRGELIVTTDADCITPPGWLATIASYYRSKKKPSMIVMPVVIERAKSFIGVFQSLDFMTLQGVTGGSVAQGFHAMCNGANLAYTRDAFDAVKGFTDIDHLASGDDMLLMDKIQRHQAGSIQYLKSDDVIISTCAMPTIHDFLHQRIRWASKTNQYKQSSILLAAGTVYFFNVLIMALCIAGLINNRGHELLGLKATTLSFLIIILLTKILIELYFLLPVARFFKREGQLFYFPFIQPLHIVYTILAGALGFFGSYKWKGRKVK